jgi:hypothetical protein
MSMIDRRRCLNVSPCFLEQIIKGEGRLAISDAPDDLEVTGCYWDASRHCAVLIVCSESFDELIEGQAMPVWDVTFQIPEGAAA